ncbi:MAG: ATP-grasp domain-containing protein [Promethearchaeota archaeon]
MADVLFLSNGSLLAEKQLLESMFRPVTHEFWKDVVAPLPETPSVVRWMLEPANMIFQFDVIEDLERRGARIINSPEHVMKCDKASIYFLWSLYLKSEIDMPESIITSNIDAAAKFILARERTIIKPLDGQQGLGIAVLDTSYPGWMDIVQAKLKGNRPQLIQELIESPGYEIRTIIIGDEVAGQYVRYNPHGLHNLSAGAKILPISDPKLQISTSLLAHAKAVAFKVKELVDLDMIAVDIMPDIDGNPWLLEWNPFFAYKGCEQVGVNIASSIVDYIHGLALKYG